MLTGPVAFLSGVGCGIRRAGALALATAGAVPQAIDMIASRLRLDILHSHAGIQVSGRLEDASVADMNASWALNVRAHFVAAMAVMWHTKAQRSGSIIITASNAGVQVDRGMIADATTKHAVVAMPRQIAADFATYIVRCNALCPGFVDTPFNRGFEAKIGGGR